jgi:polar amino acid transport system permease protein
MAFAHILRTLATGLGYTVLVTLVCFSTGIAIGLLTALLGRLGWKPVDLIIAAFTYVFRAIPVLVLLFIVFFGLPMMGVRVSPILSMVLSLGLISGAYLSEIFRGAINSIGTEEIMAAEAMGMTKVQTFFYIILPQILRISVPAMTNEFTSVLKYSPFAYTVGIPEIMKEAMSLTAVTLRGLEIYVAVGIMYFLIYRVFCMLFSLIEKKYQVPGLSADQGG